ncbi:9741_t:CDS:1 [Acaulospora morrowiae]|uniref:9741_t:CDS:1 n=1 Tax=Acaulospora morrowiae TaxID=94023 RepID=A0A9N9B1T5_9GLOM|nr:9741_t:CDS:1 [Acaulospora morrowiae]
MIAEKWKSEPSEVKYLWHQRAEEEKLKKQYRTPVGVVDGLRVSISKHYENKKSMTFVNATISTPQNVTDDPESYIPGNNTFQEPTLNISDKCDWVEVELTNPSESSLQSELPNRENIQNIFTYYPQPDTPPNNYPNYYISDLPVLECNFVNDNFCHDFENHLHLEQLNLDSFIFDDFYDL